MPHSQRDSVLREVLEDWPPFEIAAAKALRLLGRSSDEKTTERLGLAFHYGLAVGWAPTHVLLRRRTTLQPSPPDSPRGRRCGCLPTRE